MKRLIILAGMILYDISLHFSELIGTEDLWWLWFPLREQYTIFWITYWLVALVIVLSLIGGKNDRKAEK